MTTAISLVAALVVHGDAALSAVRQPHALPAAVAYLASQPLGAALFMGLGVTCGGLWLELVALQHISSAEASLIYASEPLWGATLAYASLDERIMGLSGWCGAALTIGSVMYIQLGSGVEAHQKA